MKDLVNIFKYASGLRFALALARNRLNIQKTIKLGGGPALRFGLACVLFSAIQKTLRKMLDKKVSKDFELFAACGLSSLGLLVATPGDVNIFKVLLYSRAVISILKLGAETGLYKPAGGREDKRWVSIETFICVMCCTFMIYVYLFEVKAMPPSFVRTITRTCGLEKGEM